MKTKKTRNNCSKLHDEQWLTAQCAHAQLAGQDHQPFSLTRDLFTLYLSFVLSQTSRRRKRRPRQRTQRRLWSFSYICTYEKNPLHFRFFGSCPGPLSGSCFDQRITVLWQHKKKQSGKTVDYKQQQKNDSNNNSTD